MWLRNRRWLLLAPVPVVLLLWLNPMAVGDRMVSALRPAGDLDSNQFRVVCRRAAWEMIKAHPWFGLGPEQVKAQFLNYIPADIRARCPPAPTYTCTTSTCNTPAERGVPALLVFLWFVGKMLHRFRARRAPHATRRQTRHFTCTERSR